MRDWILGVENFDVDLVVEGDGIAFAADCGHRLQARILAHRRFGTATLLGLQKLKVDIATARKEIYEKPAALPTVFHGKIQDDLLRRDFTINAMAISLNKDHFGRLFDFYGGQSDLKRGCVRALHPLSFSDDPTRILRAVRFEQRFGFRIEKTTLVWIREAVRRKMLHTVQKHRLRDELVLMFQEQAPTKSLKRLNDLCGFSFIGSQLRFKKEWRTLFEETGRRIQWYQHRLAHRRHICVSGMSLALFFFQLPLSELKKVIREFAFHKAESSTIFSLKENFLKVATELARTNVRPSIVYRLLAPLSYETVLLIMVLSKNSLVHRRIEEFLFQHHGQRLHIRGEDLKRMGVRPGPQYKKILEELLHAKIDGRVRTREDELAWAQRLAAPK